MQTKVCTKCGIEKDVESFGTRKGKNRKPGDRHAECKQCTNAHRRFRYDNDAEYKERYKATIIRSYDKLKAEVFAAYGDKCVCCDEIEPTFLTIDHVNGDGAEHRRVIGAGSKRLYQFLKVHNFPKEFQLLCYNCNCSKGHRGVCVHQLRKQLTTPTNTFIPHSLKE